MESVTPFVINLKDFELYLTENKNVNMWLEKTKAKKNEYFAETYTSL